MNRAEMSIEVLAKELEETFKGKCVNILSREYIGVLAFEMTKASVEYRVEDDGKYLVFNTGNHNTDGFASTSLNLDIIDEITKYDDEFEILLTGFISPITITLCDE